MNLTTQTYLFLSHYLPLPLSALKIIEENPSHPFHRINKLKKQEIQDVLIDINKRKNIIIRNTAEKAKKAYDLIKTSIFDKIPQKLIEWEQLGINILTYFDKRFPIKLKDIKNPPKLLFIKGNNEIESKKAISIVGTRNPSKYGKTMAFKIGYRFAEKGFVIINGFAKGIDIEAIKGGLEAGGKIIGVLGSGLLKPYPKENFTIFNEILRERKGIFISEQLPDKNVIKSSLASRNRISSALSLGNIFIEGSKNSGTTWQLKYGKEQGKPIIVLRPKDYLKKTELTRLILESEKEAFIIEKIEDIDQISECLTKSKNPKNTFINDFL